MYEKLKILLVLQTPWGTSLGMSKVHYELKKAYENMGHEVDYLDAMKIYPRGKKVINYIVGTKNIQERIFDFLKDNACKYDVIDANQRCVPYPKEKFGFKGKLIYRSHGLPPVYRIAEQHPLYKKMENRFKVNHKASLRSHIGNLKKYLMQGAGEWAFWDSIKYADIVHVLNRIEYDYLKAYGVPEEKLRLVPNGLDDEYIEKGRECINTISGRTEVSFVGSWTVRKGVDFLPEIADKLIDSVNAFNIIGTGGTKEAILTNFKRSDIRINVYPYFHIKELPSILINTKVGIFPSFVEGFGLAIIEQLALGIPVIAFDIPGPAEILKPIDDTLIVPLGDVNGLIERINMLLSISDDSYRKIAEKCIARAQDFKNVKIAERFIEIYKS